MEKRNGKDARSVADGDGIRGAPLNGKAPGGQTGAELSGHVALAPRKHCGAAGIVCAWRGTVL